MTVTKKMMWFVWALAAFFYFYEYLLRISPSVMVPELMTAFNVDGGSVGLLSAFYFYSYSPMQLPVGVLMDRYGARKLLTIASLVCGIGSVLFGMTHHFAIAAIGRLLIGAGSAFAFVGMVFICSHWFPKKKRALVIGLANSIGMLGAVWGAGPLSMTIQTLDWRVTMIAFGFLGLVLAAIIYIFVIDDPREWKASSKQKHILHALIVVMKNPYTWINAACAVCFYLTTTVFGGLWGISFLESGYGLSKQVAGFAMSMLFVGWMVGGPLSGYISDRFHRRQSIISFGIIFTALSLAAVIYCTTMPVWLLYTLLFCIGFFSAAELLNFTYAIEINPMEVKATSVAFTNGLIALGGSIMQPVTGYLLDHFGENVGRAGLPIFTTSDYQFALFPLIALLGIAFLLSLLLREQKITT